MNNGPQRVDIEVAGVGCGTWILVPLIIGAAIIAIGMIANFVSLIMQTASQ